MDFDAYTPTLFVHILAAMVLVGSSLFAPLVRHAAEAAESAAELRSRLELGRRAARANPVASLALLATGLHLGWGAWSSYGWFWVAVGAWLANAALAVLVVQRSARALAVATARAGGGPLGAEVDRLRRSRAWAVAQGALCANDVAMLYVMLAKPALLPSVSALVLANAAVLAASAVRRRRRAATGRERAWPVGLRQMAGPGDGA